MDNDSASSGNSLTTRYAVAVAGIIVGLVSGVASLISGIMYFFDISVTLPGVLEAFVPTSGFGMVLSGLLAVLAGVVVLINMQKIATSSEAGNLVGSSAYTTINKTGVTIANIVAVLAGVTAVAVLLYALLSISDYTPWKTYFLGDILPLVLVAGAAFSAGLLIKQFSLAKIKPSMVGLVVLIVAGLGVLLAAIAVGVKTHSSGSSTTVINSGSTTTVQGGGTYIPAGNINTQINTKVNTPSTYNYTTNSRRNNSTNSTKSYNSTYNYDYDYDY